MHMLLTKKHLVEPTNVYDDLHKQGLMKDNIFKSSIIHLHLQQICAFDRSHSYHMSLLHPEIELKTFLTSGFCVKIDAHYGTGGGRRNAIFSS